MFSTGDLHPALARCGRDGLNALELCLLQPLVLGPYVEVQASKSTRRRHGPGMAFNAVRGSRAD